MTKDRTLTLDGFGRHVPGDGPCPADLMLVGEAPGANEDRLGKPFVGNAGQLLEELFKQAWLSRANIYITNAVKRRPPENRTPTPTEIKFFKEELKQELERVNPRVVVAMGNIALKALTGRSGITKYRGVELDVNGRKVLPTFHTAYALRNPAATPTILADLQRAARLLTGQVSVPPTAVRIITRAREFLNGDMMHVGAADALAYDVETKGWDPLDIECYMTGVGVSAGVGTAYYFALDPNPDPDMVALLDRIFWNDGVVPRKYVAHNGKFDNRWLKRYGIRVNQTFDTMLAAYLLNENRRLALENLAVEVLGAEPYHQETQGLLEAGRADEVPVEQLAARCARDCDITLRLYHKFREDLKKDPGLSRVMAHLMMPISRVLEEVEDTGVPIDDEALQETRAALTARIKELEVEMRRLGGIAPDEKANFDSTQFLAKVMFTRLGLPVVKMTPKGKPSTDKEVLLRLQEMSPFVQATNDRRKCKKMLSSYCVRWEARLREGRLYGAFSASRTATGRLAGDLQQVPRPLTVWGKRIRDLITAKPGMVLVEADYSQIELRGAAWLAPEPTMLTLFRSGADIHTATAKDIVGATDKDARQKAKPVNFGFLYKMGATKFRTYAFMEYGIKFTEQEAEEVRRRYFHKYSGLMTYYMRQEAEVRRTLQVRSPLGRIRRLPDILSPDKEVREEAVRQAINTPIQSVASDLTLLAAIEAQRVLPDRCKLIALVHDSVVWEVPETDVQMVAHTLYRTMVREVPRIVRERFGVEIGVPLDADVKVGTRWGSLSELDRGTLLRYDREDGGSGDVIRQAG